MTSAGPNFLQRNLLMASIVAVICGCSALDVLPGKPTKKKIAYTPGPDPTPPPPLNLGTPPVPLGPERLLRRMALDATNRLPTLADLDAVVADPRDYYKLVDAYLSTDAADEALANMHERMWRLSKTHLADLDYFARIGDANLPNPVSEKLRTRIIGEPIAMVRYILDQGLPLSQLFATDFTVAHTDVLSLWGLNVDESAFPEDSLSLSLFSDGRPAVGLLGSQGFWAAMSATHSAHPRNRVASFMRSLLCFEPQDANNHLFYELTAEVLKSDIPATAGLSTPCKNCHAHFEAPSPSLASIGAGESFADWLSFSPDDAASASTYAGHPYTGIEELAALIGQDPRWHQCEVRRLTETVFQRPAASLDVNNMIRSLESFYRDDLNLKTAAAELFKSKEYGYAKVSPKGSGDYATEYSGVRLLNKHQWRGILEQLTAGAGAIEVQDSLDAGIEETMTSERRVPSGSYWHATDRVARQAAAAIVNTELADQYAAEARRVFKYLPDGNGTGATADQLRTQLTYLWRLLMGESIANDPKKVTRLVNFWNAAIASRTTADEFRDAWNTVLVGLLTHPDFFSY